jgi:short-subunit dehydrogenase
MKTMLLTGASSGIGRALAIRAARAGYAVYAVGRNLEALAALSASIRAEDGFVLVESADVAIPANATGLVARALAEFGSIDVLVNNAGFVSAGQLAAQSDDQLQRQFGTHVIGPVALVREARAALRAARGHVFMLGSGVARVPVGSLGAYPPAKAAIRSATAILRRELRPDGIAVTYVDPGAVDTPFMKRAGMPGAPAKFLISPEQVARKILIAVADRPRELNAAPWQTAIVALAERFPRLTDALLERAPTLVGGETALDALPQGSQDGRSAAPLAEDAADTVTSPDAAEIATAPDAAEIATAADAAEKAMAPGAAEIVTARAADVTLPEIGVQGQGEAAGPYEAALEPHRRRMEKLKLDDAFVRELLVPEATLELGDIALRWAGMPNKNERAITEDVLEALADAGFLERSEDRTYRVVRAP